jgi:hypothetical protein
MAKGDRAEFDRLLHSASDRQTILQAKGMANAPHKQSVGQLIWSWPVVGVFVPFIWGGGVTFMTSGHPLLADPFYISGTIFLLAKFLTWEENRKQTKWKRRILSCAGVIAVALVTSLAIWGNHKLNRPPAIEISKEINTASALDIAPGAEANVGTLQNDFTVSFGLCHNSGNDFIHWAGKVKQEDGYSPLWMFRYHVFNHSSTSITNLKLTFKATFMGGERGVSNFASNNFDVNIKTVAPGNDHIFYLVNQSRYNVAIESPRTIEIQIPGEKVINVPVITGKVIMGTFPISDIDLKYGELDLPLQGTQRPWENAGCHH